MENKLRQNKQLGIIDHTLGDNMKKSQVQQLIADRVKAVGSPLPVAFFDKMCYIESRYNPNAVSMTNCKGLFQFSSGTWKCYSSGDRLDPVKNTDAAIKLANDNYNYLKKRLKRDPFCGEVYMAHNIGAGAAAKLILADPKLQLTRAFLGSKPEYNPKYLMAGKVPATAGVAVTRYMLDFRGI